MTGDGSTLKNNRIIKISESSKLTPPPGETDENEEEQSKDQIKWNTLNDALLKKISEDQQSMFEHMDKINNLETQVYNLLVVANSSFRLATKIMNMNKTTLWAIEDSTQSVFQ